jgi:hypothetical protein
MLDKLIDNKIKELPNNIQYAIKNFDWANEILNIAKKYQLQIDDVAILRRETLLVISGLTPAEDFEKNLEAHMHIKKELAEKLVADSNEHIFLPLRKLAFTHHEEIEPELIPHEKINNIMSDVGVELVDESDTREYPKNELQDLADSLFNKKEEKHEEPAIEEVAKEQKKEKPIYYSEQIEKEDLKGIYEHRIDTSILKEKPKTFDDKLGSYLFENTHISKTENIDVSPTKEEQIKENGEFLKHIGAV